MRLPFREGTHITLVRTGTTVLKDGSVTWRGEVEETGERAVLMLWSNALLTGYFAYKGTVFTVESLGGGVHAYAEMDRRKLPADHPASSPARDSAPMPSPDAPPTPRPAPAEPAVAPLPDAERQALEAKNITIDLMVLYTGNVAKRYIRDPADLLALAIEEANETFRNSGLGNVSLRLVHSQLIDYDDRREDQFTHLYTMVDGLGAFKDVKKLRNEKRADIVGLIIDNPKGCGLSTRVGAECGRGFLRRASRLRRHHDTRSRTRSGTSSAPGTTASSMRATCRCLRAWLRQRHQVARHDELQGRLRRLPAHTLLVEPPDHVQGRADRHRRHRQRPGHSRAGRARVEIPIGRCVRAEPARRRRASPVAASAGKNDSSASSDSVMSSGVPNTVVVLKNESDAAASVVNCRGTSTPAYSRSFAGRATCAAPGAG